MTNTTLLSGYLSADQAAEQLGICRRTLWLWHKLGIGPAKTKIANKVYYRHEALISWLKQQEQASP